MGIDYRTTVDHRLDDVWSWHARPGAMRRLVPPFQPMTVVKEAESLEDGVAVLGLPAGLRWVARHDPASYVPQHRFADELSSHGLTSLPPRIIGTWKHTHTFTAVGSGTEVHDHIDAVVPAAFLRPMFAYRERQLTGDLAAHARAAQAGVTSLTVAVTGSSGLVGSQLTAFLTAGGHRVVRLVRGTAQGPDERHWDPLSPAPGLLDGVDAVVHLAGESIAGRFNDAHRQAVRDSRIEPTRLLAAAAAATENGPEVFVSASAIGYYGYDRGDTQLTEDASRGDGFLADVVTDWEAATAPAADAGLRVVLVRTGIVQAAAGGTLKLLRPLFTAGLGGRLGSGRQWLSWIGLDDLVDVYHRALWDSSLRGPVNAVGPEPVRNSEYTEALARVLHRPALLPVPSFGPKLLLGSQGARELAEASQRVVPSRLFSAGHEFRDSDVRSALAHQLGRE
jgi:uncharacterized protein